MANIVDLVSKYAATAGRGQSELFNLSVDTKAFKMQDEAASVILSDIKGVISKAKNASGKDFAQLHKDLESISERLYSDDTNESKDTALLKILLKETKTAVEIAKGTKLQIAKEWTAEKFAKVVVPGIGGALAYTLSDSPLMAGLATLGTSKIVDIWGSKDKEKKEEAKVELEKLEELFVANISVLDKLNSNAAEETKPKKSMKQQKIDEEAEYAKRPHAVPAAWKPNVASTNQEDHVEDLFEDQENKEAAVEAMEEADNNSEELIDLQKEELKESKKSKGGIMSLLMPLLGVLGSIFSSIMSFFSGGGLLKLLKGGFAPMMLALAWEAGQMIGDAIFKMLPLDIVDDIGRMITHVMAFLGDNDAQRRLDAEQSNIEGAKSIDARIAERQSGMLNYEDASEAREEIYESDANTYANSADLLDINKLNALNKNAQNGEKFEDFLYNNSLSHPEYQKVLNRIEDLKAAEAKKAQKQNSTTVSSVTNNHTTSNEYNSGGINANAPADHSKALVMGK